MSNVPFTVHKYMHSNLACLVSTNDDKYDINDVNRIAYTAKFNKEIPNLFCVADENGYIKFFKSYPKIKPVKEINAEKSCIYDLQWSSSYELVCGGGDKHVSVYDVNKCLRTVMLNGHTESVKSISLIDNNPFVIASGARDGSILIYDIRCNKTETTELVDSHDPSSTETYTVSHIRPINSILKAHFIDNGTTHASPSSHSSGHHGLSRVLKSKTSSLLNNQLNHSASVNNHHLKRATPVSCVLFQNDHYLASAGATDGLIKVWDIRKVHLTSIKKHVEPTPVHIFDNQLKIFNQRFNTKQNVLNTPSSSNKNLKGYSNLLFDSCKTFLYANCMNNYIYEYNFTTYNNNHIRIINGCRQHSNNSANKKHTFNLNQSNFIKSSLSKCDNYLLTGSSDFNAYIYTTNINNHLDVYKHYLPVIALKGHTNEVTTVDWNPFDSNQLVTCSDDNSIRVWNVRREMELIESKSSECNFLKAEVLDEFQSECENDVNNSAEATMNKVETDVKIDKKINSCNENDEINDTNDYFSTIRLNNRVFNKCRPHSMGLFDDYLFIGFEHRKFRYKDTKLDTNLNFVNNNIMESKNSMDMIENELCIKCENINIDRDAKMNKKMTSSISPTSNLLNSIEHDLIQSGESDPIIKNMTIKNATNNLINFNNQGPLSNLPINIIESIEDEMKNVTNGEEHEKSKNFFFKRQSSSNILSLTGNSVFSQLNATKTTKVLKERTKKQANDAHLNSPSTNRKNKNSEATTQHLTPKRSITVRSSSTSKKRNFKALLNLKELRDGQSDSESTLMESEQEPRTPQSKRRLLMPTCFETATGSNPNTPNHKLNSHSVVSSPIRTILHYFSPKPAGK